MSPGEYTSAGVTQPSPRGRSKQISEGVKGIEERDNMVNDYTDGKRKPKNPNSLGPPPPFPTWRNAGCFSLWPLQPILLGYVVFTAWTLTCLCLQVQSHRPLCRACKETTDPCQHTATAVYHRGFPRWDCYAFGFVAGTAYAKRTCPYPYLPAWGSQGRAQPMHVSCCPFCTYTVQNDLAYLNHIVCTHYNTSFACGACLNAITSSGQQMKNHIKECSGLAPPPTAS